MWPRIGIAAGLVLAAAGLAVRPASAEEGYRHGRIRFVEPGVTLQRATEVAAEEAVANLPFLPGDRVWTDGAGRAEFQFPDGSVVRLDRGSKLDYAGHDEAAEERVVLRLWSGCLLLRVRTRELARLEVETPSGIVQVQDRGLMRVDVAGGETRLSVYEGETSFDDGHGRVRLAAGERTWARWGEAATEPERFDRAEGDAFAEWDAQRESEEQWAQGSSEYLPPELDPYAGEFERHGAWRYEGSVGYVWTPHVAAGWQPYSNGHWAWTPYGWTWVPYEPWGWAPSHYGRWGFAASFGWYWVPGHTWGPAWVSWGIGGGYVGWCPMGRHDRPVASWPHHGGRGRAGRGHGDGPAWNIVRHGDLGGRDLARRRLGVDRVGPDALRVAESGGLRPTRDGRSLREAKAIPHAISRRPTPGDFVRELAVDNKTTIPSPWLRRRGGTPGVDETRSHARRETPTERAGTRRGERLQTETSGRRMTGGGEARPSGGVREAMPAARTERRAPSAGWGSATRERAASRERTERGRPSSGSRSTERGSAASPPLGAPSEYRPRSQGSGAGSGGSGGEYRPRGESSAGGASRPGSEGGARPRGGGAGRPAGAGASRQSGGGGSRDSGHATPRPRRGRE